MLLSVSKLDSITGDACSPVVEGYPDTYNTEHAILMTSLNMTYPMISDISETNWEFQIPATNKLAPFSFQLCSLQPGNS